MRLCSIEGCNKPHKARGWCNKHYQRWCVGTPVLNHDRIAARLSLYSIPEPNSGCWLWTANYDKGGYGRIKYKGRDIGAHRASWIIYRGSIPPGAFVCHKCDVPECINPDHLYLGNHRENMQDKCTRNRQARGEGNGQSKLTSEQVLQIKSDPRIHRIIAASYGIHRVTVSKIKRGKKWGHLTGLGQL